MTEKEGGGGERQWRWGWVSVAENRRLDVVTCIKCYQAQPALPCKCEEQSGVRTKRGGQGTGARDSNFEQDDKRREK